MITPDIHEQLINHDTNLLKPSFFRKVKWLFKGYIRFFFKQKALLVISIITIIVMYSWQITINITEKDNSSTYPTSILPQYIDIPNPFLSSEILFYHVAMSPDSQISHDIASSICRFPENVIYYSNESEVVKSLKKSVNSIGISFTDNYTTFSIQKTDDIILQDASVLSKIFEKISEYKNISSNLISHSIINIREYPRPPLPSITSLFTTFSQLGESFLLNSAIPQFLFIEIEKNNFPFLLETHGFSRLLQLLVSFMIFLVTHLGQTIFFLFFVVPSIPCFQQTDFSIIFTIIILFYIILFFKSFFLFSLGTKSSFIQLFFGLDFMLYISMILVKTIITIIIPEWVIMIISFLSPSYSLLLELIMISEIYTIYGKVTWSSLDYSLEVSFKQLISFQIISFFIYFTLYIISILFHEKESGLPLIGWRHIFEARRWKSLFYRFFPKQISNLTIEAHKLVKKYEKDINNKEEIKALDELDFELKNNEVVVLIGPNGSGKTTLIKSLICEIEPDEGNISIGGEDFYNVISTFYENVGVVFQNDIFLSKLSVRSTMEIFAEPSTVNEVSELMEITNLMDRLCETLSGGEGRKVSIAIALLSKPKVLILDEPTSGIDVSTRNFIWTFLSNFKETSVLISTHALEESEAVSTRLSVLVNGRIVASGTTNDLREQYGCCYILHILQSEYLDNFSIENVFQIVKEKIPTAQFDENSEKIKLPFDSHVEEALDELENRNIHYTLKMENLEETLIQIMENEESIDLQSFFSEL